MIPAPEVASDAVASIDDVLSFWFGEPATNHAELAAKIERWFRRGAELDAPVRDRFGATLSAARRGALDAWSDGIRGRLALIVVLDQFPRHVHRGRPECYASDRQAQALAVEALELDTSWLPVEARMMMRMPLAHAEDLTLQELSTGQADRLVDAAPVWARPIAALGAHRARHHRSIIERFGRFPHRNDVLGRAATAAEGAFLETERARPDAQAGGGA